MHVYMMLLNARGPQSKQCENHENIVKSTPRGIIYAKMVIFNINMNIDAPGGS